MTTQHKPSDEGAGDRALPIEGRPTRLTVAYDGAPWAGWQRQTNAPTVQATLEDALTDLCGCPIVLHGAGRTDAGVHALGQVAHGQMPERLPPEALVHGTNHRLPPSIRVLAASRVPSDFHARKSALGKSYLYRFWRTRVPPPTIAPQVAIAPASLDIAAMREAAAKLVGRHDFSAFALAGGSHTHGRRRLFAATVEPGGWGDAEVRLRFVGDGFLRGMVRSLAGTLLEVGRGDRTADDVVGLLRTGTPRSAAGITAPARGLCMERVIYPPRFSRAL